MKFGKYINFIIMKQATKKEKMTFLKNEVDYHEEKKEIFSMKSYKDLFCDQWNECGGLITQAYAARILKKTPTRIRQMIKEKKIKGISIQEETPLVSLTEIIQLYKLINEENEYERNKKDIEFIEQEGEREYQEYIESLSPDELKMKKEKEIKLKLRKKELEEKIKNNEEELLEIEKELNPTYEELQ